jgi:multidrug efflux pump subunit AcrB
MWLIRAALRRPITILVAVIALALTAAFAVSRMRADIFPDLDLPVIYVAQPYGGMSPAQMEGYITYYYEYHFLNVNGIESVESKSIQNTALLKLTFHAGTDMSEALSQTIGYVNRARAFMPPGTVGPFIMRFDAGTVPVGYLVFKSETRSLGEIQDLALNRVRPQFATLPGLTSPPPFGGSQRTIVIRVDPDRLRSYGMAPEEVIRAVSTGNVIMPSGSVNVGDETRISPMNSVVGAINDLLELPIRTGAGPPVSIRDVGSVSDSTDIPTAYALVNGRRAVYIPVTKRPNASTLTVVREVKANLARFQALVPDDITVSYELDQSTNVSAALQSVLREAILGALLTGLMVLLFLRDWRSSVIVVVTIPFALLTAVVALWAVGQTINIMTLGGLALAVGILVDEATVAIENIHTHLARGTPVARAVLDASGEVVLPRALAMLSVVAVFVPSFFMTGVSRSLFVPLSLAIGFAMIASFLLSSSLVPVLSVRHAPDVCAALVPAARSIRDPHDRQHHRHFNQDADDRRERGPGVEPEQADRGGDRQLEEVARANQRRRRRDAMRLTLQGTVIAERPSSGPTIGAKATTMIASLSATWLSVKCGSPSVRLLQTNTIAVQGAAASRIEPAM